MYYDNGNYMQDLNYYNQNPTANQSYGYNPYMMNNFQGVNQNQQFQMQQVMPQNGQNLNAMHPAVYRIISPVVTQVVNNSNIQYITEDSLNSMVDTVYNIVEGDINLTDNSNSSSNSNETATESAQSSNCSRNSSSNSSSNSASNSNSGSNRQNSLLRDLIKILILNEIISRRRNQMFQNGMANNFSNFNVNQQMY